MNRAIENVVATLLHECVHLFCLQNGIKDTSRGGQYHNKRFRAEAEARDLHIEYSERIGWSITEPTDALIEFILEQGWSEILMNRTEGFSVRGGSGSTSGGVSNPPRGTTSHVRKYQCPCCGNSVRATKAVNIACLDCGERMIIVG